MSVNVVLLLEERQGPVGLPSLVSLPREQRGKISGIFIIATVGAAQGTTEKLVFSVFPHRLRNTRGYPLPPPDRTSVQSRHSTPSTPSSPR